MDSDIVKLKLNPEYKEFFKDLSNVVISYTPVSGFFDTLKFSHKWFGKRKVAHRIHAHVQRTSRRSYIKSRSKRAVSRRKRFKYQHEYS